MKYGILDHIYKYSHIKKFKYMAINISFINKINIKVSSNTVIFVDEKFSAPHIKKFVSKDDFFYINDLLKTKDPKKKILFYEINSKKKNFFNIN